MSRKVYHKIWENPPHPFEGQPGNYKVKEEVVNSRKGALIITNSNRAYFYKVLVCGLQEEGNSWKVRLLGASLSIWLTRKYHFFNLWFSLGKNLFTRLTPRRQNSNSYLLCITSKMNAQGKGRGDFSRPTGGLPPKR